MKELNINEIRKVQLAILKEVAQYCDENNIRYSLAYGTLLGAIRHKGYIPWDDDIDIFMPRPDYERFIRSFNGSTKDLKVYAAELDHKFLYQFAKVSNENTLLIEEANTGMDIGINIDIFPIDGIDIEDTKLLRRQALRRRLFTIKMIRIDADRNLVKNIILVIGKIVLAWLPMKHINKNMIQAAKTYSFVEESYACNIATGYDEDRPVPKYYFENFIECSFENETFMITSFYDEWLNCRYGNYMELPPVEDRVTHHKFKAYFK